MMTRIASRIAPAVVLASASLLTVLALAACGGTPLPPELVNTGGGGNGPTASSLPKVDVKLTGFVGGDSGDGSVSPLSAGRSRGALQNGRGQQSSLAQTTGGTVSGANGVDLKDLGWGNLFSQGLTTAAFPSGALVSARFLAENDPKPLATMTAGTSGLFVLDMSAAKLSTGAHLVVELTVNAQISTIRLPQLNLHDGDQLGFNIIRRQNGTLIVETFVDGFNNTTHAAGADGLADNGIRIVTDNGVDLSGDGNPDLAARLDTADGFCFFDLNLDGRFGDPDSDGVLYVDANGTGYADTPFLLASESARAALEKTELVGFAFDPELDGVRSPESERKLGSGTESDLIDALVMTLAPATLPANGVSSGTMRVEARAKQAGIPFGAALSFSIARTGGVLLSETGGEAKFISNNSLSVTRLLTPADSEIRLLSDGTFQMSESFIAPLLTTESVDPETTKLDCKAEALNRRSEAAISQTLALVLTPSTAPVMSRVDVGGQSSIGSAKGLEAASRAARLVWGDVVRVNGENFGEPATAPNIPTNMIVSVGGTPATVLAIGAGGTTLDFEIGEGTVSGPISVIIAGQGASTSQSLIVAGAPFVPVQISPPAAAGAVPANTVFAVTMSRPIAAASVSGDAFFVRPVGGASLGWNVSLTGDRTLSLSEGTLPLPVTGSFEVVLTSELIADDADPTLRFDATPGSAQASGQPVETRVIATFTVAPVDNTQPTITASVPGQSATDVDPRAPITVTFDEPIDPASVADAADHGELDFYQSGTFESVAVDYALNAAGTVLTVTPRGILAGATTYVLVVPGDWEDTSHALQDRAGNTLSNSDGFSLEFTTALLVAEFAPRSSPVDSDLHIFGGKFGTTQTGVSVTIGGVPAPVHSVEDNEIVVTVPVGAHTGNIVVTIGEKQATAPVPFTLTLPLTRVDLPRIAGSRPFGVAISADDTRVFISNQGNGTVAVYDLNTLQPVAVDGVPGSHSYGIPMGAVPSEAVMSRDGTKLLSLDYGDSAHPGDSFYVVNAIDSVGEPENESYSIEATIPVGFRPTRIATSPDGRRWYVTSFLDDRLTVIQAEAPYQVVATVTTGRGPNGVGISPDGSRGYVCNFLAGTVTVFDTASNETVGTVPVGVGPARARVSPDGRWVFVSCTEDSTLHVIATATNQDVASRHVNAGPAAITFSRTGDKFYLCSRIYDTVTVYNVGSEGAVPDLAEIGNISTGRIPAGIAITNDGSRLVVTNEGDGFASVIYLEPPVQTVTGLRLEDGRPVRSAEYPQFITIAGSGFAAEVSSNTVIFNGVETAPTQEGSNTKQLRVQVPQNATSGPLTVRIGSKVSNAFDFIVNPSIPKVIRLLPANGAVGVSPATSISIKFNEPVIPGTGNFLLERLSDTVVGDERAVVGTVSGTVTLGDFDEVAEFVPDLPLAETAGSNNIYRFTVRQQVTDLAGKPLERDYTTVFRLNDTRGPTLLRAVFIDVDNNGVDPLDVLNLVFDEDVTSAGLPADLGTAGSAVGFNDASTLGAGASVQFPTLAALQRNSPLEQLDPFSRTIMIRLGTGAALSVPGARTAVTSLANFTGPAALVDLAGNAALTLNAAAIDIEFFLQSVPVPLALSAVLVDQNSNGIAESGEQIGIYCDGPLNLVGTVGASDFTLSPGTASFGSGATFELSPGNARVINIVCGTGASFDFGAASNDRIACPTGVAGLVSFTNDALAPWTGNEIVYSIGQNSQGPEIDSAAAQAVVLADTDDNGLDAGDVISITFDRPVVVGNAPASLCFRLPVAGDSFGAGASVRGATNPRVCEIVLGANPNLTVLGSFAAASATFGSASGIEVNPTIPLWAVCDIFGNTARNTGVFDVLSADTRAPHLLLAQFRDTDSDGALGAGDRIQLVFDERISRNGVTASAFRGMIGTTPSDFGTGASLLYAQSTAVNNTLVEFNTLEIVIGTNPTAQLQFGLDVELTTAGLSDFSGNQVAVPVRVPLTVPSAADPVLLRAVFLDPDQNGSDEGDLILARFSQPMYLASSPANPDDLFQLTLAGSSFGSGAACDIPSVTAQMISLGLTTQAIGTTDRSIVRVTLGQNASLTRLGAVFSGNESFTGQNLPGPDAAGLRVNYTPVLAFTAFELTQVFADSSDTGSTYTFDGVALDPDGISDNYIYFTFTPGGGETAFSGSPVHFQRLVGALNGAFISNGLKLRAYHNAAANELLIVDFGEGALGQDGNFPAFGDAGTSVTGAFTAGVTLPGVTNFNRIGAVGAVDIQTAPDPVAPQLVSALHDPNAGAFGIVEVTFSEPMELSQSQPAATLFALPVAGNTFGVSATATQLDFNRIRIALGSGAVITGNGTFAPGNLNAGAASGIRPRANLSPSILADTAGNAPNSAVIVDIAGGTATITDIINVAGVGSVQPTFDIASATPLVALGFTIGPATATDSYDVASLAFNIGVTGASGPVPVADAVVSAALWLDADANGAVSQGDTRLSTGALTATGASFTSPFVAFVTGAPQRFLLVLDIAPSATLAGAVLSAGLTSGAATNSVTAQAATFNGLPVNGGNCTFKDGSNIGSVNGALFSGVGPVIVSAAGGRTGQGAAGLGELDQPFMVITAAQLVASINASATGGSSDLDGVGINLTGNSTPDVTVSTTTGGFSGGIDQAAERASFAAAVNLALGSSPTSPANQLSAAFDAAGNLVFRLKNPDGGYYGQSGQSGGLLQGGDCSARAYCAIQMSSYNPWGGHTGVVFGGQNGAGAYLNDVVVIAGEGDGADAHFIDIAVKADPSFGLPAARRDMAFVADDAGNVIMYGGRDATQVFDDVWMLSPVNPANIERAAKNMGGSNDGPRPTAMQWRRLSQSGTGGVHSAAAVFVSSSPSVSRSLIVAGGASAATGAVTPSNAIRAYSLATNQWSTLNASGAGSFSARWGAAGVIRENNVDSFCVFGGRSGDGASTTTNDIQVISLAGAANSYSVSVMATTGAPWKGGFRAAAVYASSESFILICGGVDASGTILGGASLVDVTSPTTGEWRPLTDEFTAALAIPPRAGASIIGDLGPVLAFGEDAGGPKDTVIPLQYREPGFSDDGGTAAPILAYFLPIAQPVVGTSLPTADMDANEKIVLVFGGPTNLLDQGMFPAGTMTEAQINSLMRLSDFYFSNVSFPAGTSAVIQSRFRHADTLIIALGASVPSLNFPSAAVNFSTNAASSQPILRFGSKGSNGSGFGGSVPVTGVADAAHAFIWTGATSSDWFTAGNWTVGGIVPTGIPGTGDGAYILYDSLIPRRPCVISSGTATAHRVVVDGAFLRVGGQLVLSDGANLAAPAFSQALGGVIFDGATGGRLDFNNGTGAMSRLAVFGATALSTVATMAVSGSSYGRLEFTGSATFTGNLDTGTERIYPSEDFGGVATFVGAASSSVIADSAELWRLVCAKTGTAVLNFDGVTGSASAREVIVFTGGLVLGDAHLVAGEVLYLAPGTTFSNATGMVTLSQTDAQVLTSGQDLGKLEVAPDMQLGDINGSFDYDGGSLYRWTQVGGTWNVTSSNPGVTGYAAVLQSTTGTLRHDPFLAAPIPEGDFAVSLWVKIPAGATIGLSGYVWLSTSSNGPSAQQGFNIDPSNAGTWMPVVMRTSMGNNGVPSFSSLTLDIVVTSGPGTVYFDNVAIQGVAEAEGGINASGGLTISNALVECHVPAAATLALGNATITNSMVLVEGSGTVDLSGMSGFPAGSLFSAEGSVTRNTSGVLSGKLQILTPGFVVTAQGPSGFALSGTLMLTNAVLNTPAASARRIAVQPGGLLVTRDVDLNNCAVSVAEPVGGIPAAVSLDRTSWGDAPPPGLTGTNTAPTCLSLLAPTLNASVLSAVRLTHLTFGPAIGGPKSVECAAATPASTDFYTVTGGPLTDVFAPREVEAAAGSDPRATGAIRWDDSQIFRYGFGDRGERYVAGGTGVVIADFTVELKQAVVWDSFKLGIRSNFDDSAPNTWSNFKVVQVSGVGQPTTLTYPSAVASTDDPVLTLTGSEIMVILSGSASCHFQIVADLGSGVPAGAYIVCSVFDFQAPINGTNFRAVYDPSLSSPATLDLGGSDDETTASRIIVGGLTTPTVKIATLGSGIYTPIAGDQLLIYGANLSGGFVAAGAVGASGLINSVGSYVLPGGNQVANIAFTSASTAGFTGKVTVTFTPVSGTPVTFTFKDVRTSGQQTVTSLPSGG